MFNLIQPNYTEVLKREDPNLRKRKRLNEVKKFILDLGKPLKDLLPEIHVRMMKDPFDVTPCTGYGRIYIPALCLVKNDELAKFYDPKKLACFLTKHLGTDQKNPGFLEKENVLLCKKFLQNQDKASKAIKYVFAHELGHVVYRDVNLDLLPNKIALIGAAVFGACAQNFIYPIDELWQIKTLKLCFGSLVAATSLASLHLLSNLKENRQTEKRADLFSFHISPEASEGAIYLYDVLKQHFQRVKKKLSKSSLPWYKRLVNHLLINSDGELRILNWTHGSFSERMKRAKEFTNNQSESTEFITMLVKD